MSEEVKRVEFTRKMKSEYTILIPNMAPIHFEFIKSIFIAHGYNMELLYTSGREIADTGLKYVHNDTCYPALLCIGQLIGALQSGKYDVNKTALMISQSGGGCRASNYIHLLRKALTKAGYPNVPVISLNLSGMEKNSGFRFTLPMILKCIYAIYFADMMMLCSNQLRPYEINEGDTDRKIKEWLDRLTPVFKGSAAKLNMNRVGGILHEIAADFAGIPVNKTPRVRVGIVGEIYVKYSSLANNGLEKFLASQGCEVCVPGMANFLMFKIDNRIEDIKLYGGSAAKKKVCTLLLDIFTKVEGMFRDAVTKAGVFTVPSTYEHLKHLAAKVIGPGCKMGEGWLLTAEMMELIETGYPNVVCTQPFGCLPNHIVGKGMVRSVKEVYPEANIVPIDYDPGATKVNQENRIKLMLAVAAEKLGETKSETQLKSAGHFPMRCPAVFMFNTDLRGQSSYSIYMTASQCQPPV